MLQKGGNGCQPNRKPETKDEVVDIKHVNYAFEHHWK